MKQSWESSQKKCLSCPQSMFMQLEVDHWESISHMAIAWMKSKAIMRIITRAWILYSQMEICCRLDDLKFLMGLLREFPTRCTNQKNNKGEMQRTFNKMPSSYRVVLRLPGTRLTSHWWVWRDKTSESFPHSKKNQVHSWNWEFELQPHSIQ